MRGWGGSAHYPDPTAQSVEPVYAERRIRAPEDPEHVQLAADDHRRRPGRPARWVAGQGVALRAAVAGALAAARGRLNRTPE